MKQTETESKIIAGLRKCRIFYPNGRFLDEDEINDILENRRLGKTDYRIIKILEPKEAPKHYPLYGDCVDKLGNPIPGVIWRAKDYWFKDGKYDEDTYLAYERKKQEEK